jgi:release factor glutamine methyltransferase
LWISEILEDSNLPRFEAELLLGAILGFSQTKFFANPDFEISEKDFMRFRDLEKMRLAGKSVAAILSQKEFFGLNFFVDKNVLIPRPETEILVEEVLKIQPKSLLDVGTGSGCVAISVKKNLPNCKVWASDISPAALKVAQKNSQNLGVKIEFIESDLLEKISREFEIIVANLPYVSQDSEVIEAGVKKFEPSLALFSGADGLDLIRKLLIQISQLSQKPKFVLLEFGGGKQTEVLERFTKKLFLNTGIEILSDLAGIPRVLKLQP